MKTDRCDFSLILQAHFVCAATESFRQTQEVGKVSMLCLVFLFLFKFLAKSPRVFLSASLCFSLISLGATEEGKLRKLYQN